jgi:folate-binding protein YgfZ
MAEPQAAAISGHHLLPRDTLLVRGPDRKTWLDGLLSCGVAAVAPALAAYGLLLTKQGKIVSDVFLADSGQELFVGVAPGHGTEVQALFDRYLVMEDAELDAPASPVVWLLASREAGTSRAALATGELTVGSLSASLAVVPASEVPAGDGPGDAAGLLAEHGLGVFGVDFDQHDNPHEASLDRVAVSWTKGCYLGQVVVCMQDMRGKVKRRLVALAAGPALLGAAPAAGSERPPVLGADAVAVGQVTSVHRSANGARLLASISTSALQSAGELSVLGEPVRVVAGSGLKLS